MTCATSPPISRSRSHAGAAKDRDLVAAGQKLYRGGDSDTGVPACSGVPFAQRCRHSGSVSAPGGQHGDYTVAQLQSFRSGERSQRPECDDAHDRRPLSDKEMAAVAEYISGLR